MLVFLLFLLGTVLCSRYKQKLILYICIMYKDWVGSSFFIFENPGDEEKLKAHVGHRHEIKTNSLQPLEGDGGHSLNQMSWLIITMSLIVCEHMMCIARKFSEEKKTHLLCSNIIIRASVLITQETLKWHNMMWQSHVPFSLCAHVWFSEMYISHQSSLWCTVFHLDMLH